MNVLIDGQCFFQPIFWSMLVSVHWEYLERKAEELRWSGAKNIIRRNWFSMRQSLELVEEVTHRLDAPSASTKHGLLVTPLHHGSQIENNRWLAAFSPWPTSGGLSKCKPPFSFSEGFYPRFTVSFQTWKQIWKLVKCRLRGSEKWSFEIVICSFLLHC